MALGVSQVLSCPKPLAWRGPQTPVGLPQESAGTRLLGRVWGTGLLSEVCMRFCTCSSPWTICKGRTNILFVFIIFLKTIESVFC